MKVRGYGVPVQESICLHDELGVRVEEQEVRIAASLDPSFARRQTSEPSRAWSRDCGARVMSQARQGAC